MNNALHVDLAVLGGGAAGIRAAMDAASAGMKTVLMESGFLGGTCLNVGCIPTKYLLGASAALPLLETQLQHRVFTEKPALNLEALQDRKDHYIKGLRQSLEKQLTEAGITVLSGRGVFTSPQSLTVKGKGTDASIVFHKCIVATGSAPASYPGLKPDGARVKAAAALLGLREAPRSLIIIGGGPIGLELGEFFHRLGTRITVAEVAPRILPSEDPDISETVRDYLTGEGWVIHTGRKLAQVATEGEQAVLRFEDGEAVAAEQALLAVGRRPVTAGLSPEAAGIRLSDRGWFAADACLQCAEHIYAVGDANGRTLIANAAMHQAAYAASHAAGRTSATYQPPSIPFCLHGNIEVMRAGPTIAQLRDVCDSPLQSSVPLASNPVAQSHGQAVGFVRMLWEGDILRSVCAVGHGVTRLMAASTLLIGQEIQKNNPLPIVFAHPALDEVLESAMVAPRKNMQ